MTWSEAMSAKRNLGDELIEALNQARDLEHGKGRGAARVHLVPRTARESAVPPAPAYSHRRVSKLRSRLALSQPIFAAALNVSPETVRAWEQGKRHPDGAALRLLELTEQSPDLLLSLVSEKVRKPYAARVLKRISRRTPIRLKESAADIVRAMRGEP
jgi:putative transcriptional regulator